jgi:hypothetical protein
MLKSLVLSALLAAGALASARGAEPPSGISPLTLFKSACMEGSVKLSKEAAALVPYRRVPQAAKKALGQAALRLDNPQLFRIPPAEEVPNPIFRIGKGKDLFLMAPIPASSPASRTLGHSCAVIWKGDQYLEARQLLLPQGPASIDIPRSLPRDNSLGFAHMSTTSGDLQLTAAALSGWTVLKSTRMVPEIPGEP